MIGVGILAQWDKPCECQFKFLLPSFWSYFLPASLGKDQNIWVLATHMREQEGVPGAWRQLAPAPAWGMNQSMQDLSHSFSFLSLSCSK